MTYVSVVIPTRDRPELLALTVHSVLSQGGVTTEVLVIDDGDHPATAAVVNQFKAPQVQLLTNAGDRGVSGARNTGIRAARGQWIAFCDDDDLWAPDKLATQLATARKAGAGWVYAGHVLVDEQLHVLGGGPPPRPEEVVAGLRTHNAVPAGASNVVVRRDVLEIAGRFDPLLRTSEDWDLWLRLAATGMPAAVFAPKVALRVHAAMASRHVDQMLSDLAAIAERHAIPVDRARHERWAAWMCLEDGRRAAAVRHYARAAARGNLTSLARAGVALVRPGVARRRGTSIPDGWARGAQAWLDDLKEAAARAGLLEAGGHIR